MLWISLEIEKIAQPDMIYNSGAFSFFKHPPVCLYLFTLWGLRLVKTIESCYIAGTFIGHINLLCQRYWIILVMLLVRELKQVYIVKVYWLILIKVVASLGKHKWNNVKHMVWKWSFLTICIQVIILQDIIFFSDVKVLFPPHF